MYLSDFLLQFKSLSPQTLELCLHPLPAQLDVLQWTVQRDAGRVQLQPVLLQPYQLVSDGQLLLLRLPFLSLQDSLLFLQLRAKSEEWDVCKDIKNNELGWIILNFSSVWSLLYYHIVTFCTIIIQNKNQLYWPDIIRQIWL